MSEFVRVQKILDAQEDSVFLWGARQVGKSTLIKNGVWRQNSKAQKKYNLNIPWEGKIC